MALLILNATDLDIDACCVRDHCHLSEHIERGHNLPLGCPRS